MRDRVTELRRVRAGDLEPHPSNWRGHPEPQQAALRGILEEVGWAAALIAYESNGGLRLIDGHLRAGIDPDEEVPVLVVDVDDAEAEKLLVSLDPISAMARADGDKLRELLDSVQVSDAGLGRMLADLAKQAAPPRGEDTGPMAPPEAPKTKMGDLYALGRHRLLCGDCRTASIVGSGVDAMWTDPPYGVDYVGKTQDALTIQGDTADDLEGLLTEALRVALGVLAPGAPFYIAAPAGRQWVSTFHAIEAAGLEFHQGLVWVKDSMVLGHSDYHFRHENLFYGWVPGNGRSGRGNHDGSRWFGDHSQTSVLEFDRPKRSEDHPTMKPVDLVRYCIENSTPGGGSVLDPFLGSGTTLIAAEQSGRSCIGVEIDPAYCDVAVARWERYTGEKAELQ